MRIQEHSSIYSIITVVFNAERFIEETLKSIENQTFKNYELIVIDGGSTDRTLDIVRRAKIDRLKLVSEPDKGIYDAMNKGIDLSAGEYLYFLNAGDYLYSNEVLSKVYQYIFTLSKPDIFYGNVIGLKDGVERLVKVPDSISHDTFIKRAICHQAVFAKRSLFCEYGKFDLSFPIVADYVWLAKMYMEHRVDFLYADYVICYYSLTGMSSTSTYSFERFRAALRHYSFFYLLRKRYVPWLVKRIKRVVRHVVEK